MIHEKLEGNGKSCIFAIVTNNESYEEDIAINGTGGHVGRGQCAAPTEC